MPGIAGIISRAPASDCRRRVTQMLQTMRHEEFYTAGTCDSEYIGVYAGWVSHPASFAERTSGPAPSNRIDIAFAGECVQDAPLVAGYEQRGEHVIRQLNGLFSGLIIDHQRQRAFLFNDRLGAERIYVHESGDEVYFASEAKAILRVAPQTRQFGDDGVAEFLTFGCALGGNTLFRSISRLPAASLWTIERGFCRKATYFDVREWEQQETLTAGAFERQLHERVADAVARQARSDRRIGISLTGGLDTRMIMACLPPVMAPPVSYTFAGVRGQTHDARIASQVAAICGLEHHTVRVEKDFLANYGEYLARTVYITDGTAGALGAHEIYLNAKARALSPIRLTGNFGSEILRSMSTFKPLRLAPEIFAPEFRLQLDRASRASVSVGSPVTFAAFHEIPWNLFGTTAAAKSQVELRTPYLDYDLVALAYQAPPALRLSSAPSLRVVQSGRPALGELPTDRGVIAGGRGIGYRARRLLSELSFKLDYLHKEALPPSVLPLDTAMAVLDRVGVLGGHKYLPFRLWFRHELAEYARHVISDPATRRMPYWDPRSLTTLVDDHRSGARNRTREIHAVLTLATAHRLLVRDWASDGEREVISAPSWELPRSDDARWSEARRPVPLAVSARQEKT